MSQRYAHIEHQTVRAAMEQSASVMAMGRVEQRGEDCPELPSVSVAS